MKFNGWKWLLLVAVVMVQAGCATEKQTYDDTPPLESAASQDDNSHGWGASVQSAVGR